ncbi:MAG: Mannosylglycerate hydrolase [Firmicutes bacterium]|nr:Mannosylglycerate hydrolase [Bacillota bacterium]
MNTSKDAFSGKTVFIVPYSHWDVDFEKTFDEYKITVSNVIIDAIDLITKKPSFRFTVNQAIFIKYFWENYPDYQDKFRRYVQEGRIEIVGGKWVQPDLNLVSGEALVRDILLGNEWIKNTFGVESEVAWEIDIFGHPGSTPHFLSQAGYKYYVFARLELNEYFLGAMGTEVPGIVVNMFHLKKPIFEELHYKKDLPQVVNFWWQNAEDKLLTHWMKTHYHSGFLKCIEEDLKLAFQRIQKAIEAMAPYSPTPNIMLLCGNDFLSPKKDFFFLPEVVKAWNEKLSASTGYKLTIATPKDFFHAVKDALKIHPVPTYELEFNPVLGSASWINRPEFKQANAQLDAKLFANERLGVLQALLGKSYPKRELSAAWQLTCTNHHHDNITGTIPEEVAKFAFKRYEEADKILKHSTERLLTDLSSRINTKPPSGLASAKPLLVFNSLPWERDDLVEIDIPLAEPFTSLRIFDAVGKEFPCQLLGITDDLAGKRVAKIAFIAENIPSIGYSIFYACSTTTAIDTAISVNSNEIENAYYHLSIDPEHGGSLISIYDKELDWELINQAGKRSYSTESTQEPVITAPTKVSEIGILGNDLIVSEDFDSYLGTWVSFRDYHPHYTTYIRARSSKHPATRVSILEKGPVKATLRIEQKLLNTTYFRDITLYASLKRVDFVTRIVEYKETLSSLVEIGFPFNLPGGVPYYETPYGIIPRPDGRYNAPAHTYATLTDGKKGIALANRGVPCYHVSEGLISLGLLKQQSLHPSLKEMGWPGWIYEYGKDFSFYYSLSSYKGNWKSPFPRHHAYEFNNPLLSTLVTSHSGSLPKTSSMLWTDNSDIHISALKFAEGGDEIVVRAFNPTGREITGKLCFNPELVSPDLAWSETDLRERRLKDYGSGNILEVDLPAFGIVTFLSCGRSRYGK